MRQKCLNIDLRAILASHAAVCQTTNCDLSNLAALLLRVTANVPSSPSSVMQNRNVSERRRDTISPCATLTVVLAALEAALESGREHKSSHTNTRPKEPAFDYDRMPARMGCSPQKP